MSYMQSSQVMFVLVANGKTLVVEMKLNLILNHYSIISYRRSSSMFGTTTGQDGVISLLCLSASRVHILSSTKYRSTAAPRQTGDSQYTPSIPHLCTAELTHLQLIKWQCLHEGILTIKCHLVP